MTPHVVNWCDSEGKLIKSFEPCGAQARVFYKPAEETVVSVDGHDMRLLHAPLVKDHFEFAQSDPNDGDYALIVSSMFADFIYKSYPFDDTYPLIVPDTGPDSVVRNADGSIFGVKNFLFYSHENQVKVTDTKEKDEKTLDEVYRQRGEAWLLAMAMAKRAGFEVGVREPGEWPAHVIYLPGQGEVALHMKASDAEPSVLDFPMERVYDGHTNEEKSTRIRAFVRETFAK